MALIKSYTMKNGIVCENAYHVITQLQQFKRMVEQPDPDGIRPDNAPSYQYSPGNFCRVSVGVWASEDARTNGLAPIAAYAQYPTEVVGLNQDPAEINIMQASEVMTFEVDTSDGALSIAAQGYAHLLTLPTWSGANTA